MKQTVRCPYCVTDWEFHAMVAHIDGRYICNKCGHTTLPSDAEYKCHCQNCRKLASRVQGIARNRVAGRLVKPGPVQKIC